MKDQLTIVIPCKNEGKIIERTLNLLYRSEEINGVRIIVADDSTDNNKTIDILKRFPIEIIQGGLPSVARNNGAKLTETPYILFLDADMFLENPKTIHKVFTHAKNNQLDLITCKIRTDNGKYNWAYRTFDMVQFMTKFHRPFAVGGFMLFNTNTFFELGMFDEDSKVAEDYQLSIKVKPSKFDISKETVYTTSRRFDNKGVFYMVKLMLRTWWGNKTKEVYYDDYGYWDNAL
jgi:glycosyltransferase involved in cell wall biosynthesis